MLRNRSLFRIALLNRCDKIISVIRTEETRGGNFRRIYESHSVVRRDSFVFSESIDALKLCVEVYFFNIASISDIAFFFENAISLALRHHYASYASLFRARSLTYWKI